jgi:hypothetical protein
MPESSISLVSWFKYVRRVGILLDVYFHCTKPITYHMDSITELHPLVEGHLMDARVQGE